MAFAGYMTEADTESIWDLGDFDTTRFAKMNVRIGEVVNFLVSEDATTVITSTAVLPLVEQISEEVFIELMHASKGSKFNNPWDFIQANVSKIDWRYYDGYLLKKVREKLDSSSTIEVVTRRLPRTTDSNVIP